MSAWSGLIFIMIASVAEYLCGIRVTIRHAACEAVRGKSNVLDEILKETGLAPRLLEQLGMARYRKIPGLWWLLTAVSASFLLFSCGGLIEPSDAGTGHLADGQDGSLGQEADDGGQEHDVGGSDAGSDAGGGVDAGGDRGADSGVDAGFDGGTDGGAGDPPCVDLCRENERRCAAGGYDVCHDSDSDGCRDWGMHVDCPVGFACDQSAVKCVADQPPAGGEVEWLEFAPLNQLGDPDWGGVLTDIVNHCPPEWVQTYYDSDRVTHGHETTHGINSYLRNYENNTGQRANGFYVLENRAAIIVEPGIRKHQAAEFVPGPLRGSRFDMYVTGQSAWDDTPLYLFDEWTAYTNGTAVAVDLYEAGAWHYGWRDACMGTLEFVVYAVALARAVESYDPDYFQSYGQFTAFLGWQLERSLDLYRRCARAEPFAWDEQDAYFARLRGADGEPLRQFLARCFGQSWVERLFSD